MNASYKMFLLVAEELNISRAAQKAFVTQQCASDHIKKLEEQYGVKLFCRKPKLSLTPAGTLMLKTVRQMQTIESAMKEQMNEISGETVGNITFGVNSTRARIILPDILKEYNKLFPKVTTTFVLHDTSTLEEMLLDNQIDIFLGVNTSSNEAFLRKKIGCDSIYLIATAKLFIEYADKSFEQLEELTKTGITLSDINTFPLVRNNKDSTINSLIDRHLGRNNIVVNTISYVSDYDTQISFCGKSLTAAFCPSLMLLNVFEHNKTHLKSEQIYIFPIKGLQEDLRIDVVTFDGVSMPKYAKTFHDILCNEVSKKYQHLQNNLPTFIP